MQGIPLCITGSISSVKNEQEECERHLSCTEDLLQMLECQIPDGREVMIQTEEQGGV